MVYLLWKKRIKCLYFNFSQLFKQYINQFKYSKLFQLHQQETKESSFFRAEEKVVYDAFTFSFSQFSFFLSLFSVCVWGFTMFVWSTYKEHTTLVGFVSFMESGPENA